MHLEIVTPLILSFNEEVNIERTINQLYWAKKIIVIDSFSTDQTIHILSTYSNVEVHQRQFDTHANQWNYGLTKIDSLWVLTLDADYWLPEIFIHKLRDLVPDTSTNGFLIPFKYCINGIPLRSAILPSRVALFLTSLGRYYDDGHTQMLSITEKISLFPASIYHDDRKPLSRWLWAQDRYAKLELLKIKSLEIKKWSFADYIRSKIIFAPFLVFFYCLVFRLGILDGWRGWYYAFQRMLAEIVLSLHLLEVRINKEIKK